MLRVSQKQREQEIKYHNGRVEEDQQDLVQVSTVHKEISDATYSQRRGTHLDGLNSGIDSGEKSKHDHGDVCKLLAPGARTCLVMEHRWIHITQGDTVGRRV